MNILLAVLERQSTRINKSNNMILTLFISYLLSICCLKIRSLFEAVAGFVKLYLCLYLSAIAIITFITVFMLNVSLSFLVLNVEASLVVFFFKELINFVIFQILGYLTSVAMVKKSSLTNHCYMPRRLLKKKKKDIGTKEGIKKRKTREDYFSLKIVSCSSFCFSLYSRNFEKKYKIENFDSTTAKKKKK